MTRQKRLPLGPSSKGTATPAEGGPPVSAGPDTPAVYVGQASLSPEDRRLLRDPTVVAACTVFGGKVTEIKRD